jgi:GcrA cell cycle regulator
MARGVPLGGDSPWTDAMTLELRTLWAAKNPELPVSAIATRLRVSKNSVVGKAHRIGLPPRPSPIYRAFDKDGNAMPPKPPAPKREHPASLLPKLASVPDLPAGDLKGSNRGAMVVKPPEPIRVAPLPVRREPPALPRVKAGVLCCYPAWSDPKTQAYWDAIHAGKPPICGSAVSVLGRNPDGTTKLSPYCPDHHARCFIPITERRIQAWA